MNSQHYKQWGWGSHIPEISRRPISLELWIRSALRQSLLFKGIEPVGNGSRNKETIVFDKRRLQTDSAVQRSAKVDVPGCLNDSGKLGQK